jgi:hypothetical protein
MDEQVTMSNVREHVRKHTLTASFIDLDSLLLPQAEVSLSGAFSVRIGIHMVFLRVPLPSKVYSRKCHAHIFF